MLFRSKQQWAETGEQLAAVFPVDICQIVQNYSNEKEETIVAILDVYVVKLADGTLATHGGTKNYTAKMIESINAGPSHVVSIHASSHVFAVLLEDGHVVLWNPLSADFDGCMNHISQLYVTSDRIITLSKYNIINTYSTNSHYLCVYMTNVKTTQNIHTIRAVTSSAVALTDSGDLLTLAGPLYYGNITVKAIYNTNDRIVFHMINGEVKIINQYTYCVYYHNNIDTVHVSKEIIVLKSNDRIIFVQRNGNTRSLVRKNTGVVCVCSTNCSDVILLGNGRVIMFEVPRTKELQAKLTDQVAEIYATNHRFAARLKNNQVFWWDQYGDENYHPELEGSNEIQTIHALPNAFVVVLNSGAFVKWEH